MPNSALYVHSAPLICRCRHRSRHGTRRISLPQASSITPKCKPCSLHMRQLSRSLWRMILEVGIFRDLNYVILN